MPFLRVEIFNLLAGPGRSETEFLANGVKLSSGGLSVEIVVFL